MVGLADYTSRDNAVTDVRGAVAETTAAVDATLAARAGAVGRTQPPAAG